MRPPDLSKINKTRKPEISSKMANYTTVKYWIQAKIEEEMGAFPVNDFLSGRKSTHQRGN
jgi:hypothetical protein